MTRLVRQGSVDGSGQIERAATIGIRARKLEKGPRRRMQLRGLRSGCQPARALEFQLQVNVLDRGIRDAHHLRGRADAAQSVGAILCADLGVSLGEPHTSLPAGLSVAGPAADGDPSGTPV